MPAPSKNTTAGGSASYLYAIVGMLMLFLLIVQITDSANREGITQTAAYDAGTSIQKPGKPEKENLREPQTSSNTTAPAARADADIAVRQKISRRPLSKEIFSKAASIGHSESLQWNGVQTTISYASRATDGKKTFTATIGDDAHTVVKSFSSYDMISNLYVADLNNNDSPELYIVWISDGNAAYGRIEGYELHGDVLKEMAIPSLQSSSGYRGYDSFTIYPDYIERSYPLFHNETQASTGSTAFIRYRFTDSGYEAKVEIIR